jgi:hypothetical protein
MMIPACGKKRGRFAKTLRQFESEHITIKSKRAFQVSHLQMDMTDTCRWMNRSGFHELKCAGTDSTTMIATQP